MECIINYLVNLYSKDPTAFWTMGLVGVTLLLFIIAWIQLGRICYRRFDIPPLSPIRDTP